MGVFMILCFIVFPYYRKESPTTQESTSPPTPTSEPEVVVQKQVIAGLTVALHWQVRTNGSTCNRDDIDLHVDAPAPNGGRHKYNYINKAYDDSPARLVTDSTRGGNEVWLHPCVTPGDYKISCVFYSSEGPRQDTLLTLIIISGEGETKEITKTIPGNTAPNHDRHIPLATVTVKENGDIDITTD